MLARMKTLRSLWALPFLLAAAPAAHAEYGLNFPPPATPIAREIYDVHMLTMGISTLLLMGVFGVVFFAIWKFRKSRGYQPDQNFHKTWFGTWSWIIVPAMVLGVDLTIAGSAQQILERLWVVPEQEGMLDVKVTGHQWYWEYEYMDAGIRVESRALPEDQAPDGLYLRDVDNRLVLPTHRPVRFLHTSADVNHAMWVPALGFKKDAIPGYITETWAEIDTEGVYRGQCAELCGTWHAKMPIVVEAVSEEKFTTWVADAKAAQAAAAAEAAADKEWSMADLMEKGKGLYNTKCASCHQINGEGLAPAFPALKGSALTVGPIEPHIDIVLNGKPGSAMPPWKGLLNDLEIAAIVTYERNAWGNDTGDAVQPRDVKALR
ncbi:MAG: cytochrome c oxidase subunit II [Gammaproteobacteria bacterium]|nr:cytochrome c oxidase subunit II [Gammaproteobacteria bacterium]